LRIWIARTAPLVPLAACAGPTSGVAYSSGGASVRAGQGSTGQRASAQASAPAGATQSRPAQGGAVRQALPSCVLTPRQSEGPYFVDERLNRSDIRSDPSDGSVREGVPLKLTLQVTQVAGDSCTPLAGAYVDLWQCDAAGAYSDVSDPRSGSAKGSKFLRGYQATDENGLVQFTTIFPGWYGGRAVHIHFMVRTELDGGRGRELVSQLYFDDALIDTIHALPPYTDRGQRNVRNDRDGLYRNGGSQLLVPVAEDGDGYAGTFNLGVQLI
jgi:protocatechuate 3,4-dioxygenase beta subunit